MSKTEDAGQHMWDRSRHIVVLITLVLVFVALVQTTWADSDARVSDEAPNPTILANNRDMAFKRVLHNDGNEYFYLVFQNRGYRFGCSSDLFQQRIMFEAVGFPVEFLPQSFVNYDDFVSDVVVDIDEQRGAILCGRDDIHLRYRRVGTDNSRRSLLYLAQSDAPRKLYQIGCTGIVAALGIPLLSAKVIRDADVSAYDISDQRVLPCYSGEVPPVPVLSLEAQPHDVSAEKGRPIPTVRLRSNAARSDGVDIDTVSNTCGPWIEITDDEITGTVPAEFAQNTCRVIVRGAIGNKTSNDVVIAFQLSDRPPPLLSISSAVSIEEGLTSVTRGKALQTVTFLAADPLDLELDIAFDHSVSPKNCDWLKANQNGNTLQFDGVAPLDWSTSNTCRVDVTADNGFAISDPFTFIVNLSCPNPNFFELSDKTCGAKTFNEREDELCGVEIPKEGRGLPCGAESFFGMRSSHCGVELYVLKSSPSCGLRDFENLLQDNSNYKSPNSNLRHLNQKYNSSIYSKFKELDTRYRIGGIDRKLIENREGGPYIEDRDSILYNECRHQDHGVSSYKFCRHPKHGVETYRLCKHSSFGAVRYRICAHEMFGVKEYNTCRRPAFGLESCS